MKTAIVTGASRGFGQGIAAALIDSGHRVVGVARDAAALEAAYDDLGGAFVPVVASVADRAVAEELLKHHRPDVVVLNAGATPPAGAIHELTWDEFRGPWETDTQQVFHWAGTALRLPLAAGSVVISMSSGAALRGSPASGGYAGAKAAVGFVSSYAAEEAARLGVNIRFVCLLPPLSPATNVGQVGARAYAARQGVSLADFVANLPPSLTPELVGSTVVQIVADDGAEVFPEPAYLLTPTGAVAVP